MQVTQGFVHFASGNSSPISCQVGDYIVLASTYGNFEISSEQADLIVSMNNANWASGSAAGNTAYIYMWKAKATSVTIKSLNYGGSYGAVIVFRQ